jgi:O-antigen ligase
MTLSNVIRVVLPVVMLVIGIFLTHSRGALVALAAVLLFAARRKLGSVSALVVTGGMVVAGLALNFTGGRAISAESGSDRTELWSEGLTLLKEHPLFGVGFGQFKQFASNTAHNSVVVCAAEVGIVGLFFWSLFLLPTIRNAFVLGSPKTVGEPVEAVPAAQARIHYSQIGMKTVTVDKAEINRLGWSIALSLVGYLAAGWFLSRAFVMSLFMLGAVVEVVFEIARRQGMVAPRLPIARCLKYSAYMMVSAVFMIYMMLRITNLTR